MVVHIIFVLMLSSHHFNFKVLGQNACNEDKNVLNNCDGSIVSNDDIYIDFGVIKSQCSCTIENINNVNAIYILSTNPGYNGCGTGIQITQSNNEIQILRCSNDSPGNVFTNLSTTVEFKIDNNSFVGANDEYCLQGFTNDVSHIVKGSCGPSATNLPMTSTDLSRNPTKIISSHLTEKDTGRTEAFTSTSNCSSMFDSSTFALTISLAIFVVISFVLAILSIYLKFRNNSLMADGNKTMVNSGRTMSGPDLDNYTELCLANVAAERDNPYDILTRQDNYTNTNNQTMKHYGTHTEEDIM
ncbi:uncharacterized protein LOC144622916 isoform X2 [Crassostrea virginica]